MKTKNLIKEKSLLLFNELGVMNVTLREVAKQLNKSYGNMTYYFTTKEQLLLELYEDMNNELLNLNIQSDSQTNLLQYILKLPEINYGITLKYLFFTKDFVEIKRHYPDIFSKANKLNNERKEKWLTVLVKLKDLGYLHEHLTSKDLEYIITISSSVRLFYFQTQDNKTYNKLTYSNIVNQLLKPYLTKKGLEVYQQMLALD